MIFCQNGGTNKPINDDGDNFLKSNASKALKGQCHEIVLTLFFLHQTTSPCPIRHA
jgi:hypothetical protein